MTFRGDLEALILAVLSDGPRHGYDIAKQIKAVSNKALAYGEGQLYPALHKLDEAGFVRADWQPNDGKPPRKVYALTVSGRGLLEKKKVEWKKFHESVSAIMGTTDMGANRG